MSNSEVSEEAIGNTEENVSGACRIKKSEEEIKQTETSSIKVQVEGGQSHVNCPINEELELLFANRYSENNAEYKKICEGFDPVIIIHPWASRTKRVYDYSQNNRGWRGRGRGNRGNNWRGGRDNYRGYHDRKRHMDDNGGGYRGRNDRVYFPGNRGQH